MASHPPGPCCIAGTTRTGSSAGSMKTIEGIRIYHSYPPDKDHTRGILLFPDANGIDLINTQLTADEFAKQGYLVLVPDLFRGHPFTTPMDDLYNWLALHPTDKVDPVVELTLKEMRALGCHAIAGVGYCFGAKYVVRSLTGLEGGLSAGFVAHPSFVTAEELGAINRPLSIAAAESDFIFSTEKRRESEDILMKMDVQWQINLYSDVEHSFAVRGDLDNPRIKWAQQEAFGQAVRWFKEHLGNDRTGK